MTVPTYPPSYPMAQPPPGRPATVTVASVLLFAVALIQLGYSILVFSVLDQAGEVYDTEYSGTELENVGTVIGGFAGIMIVLYLIIGIGMALLGIFNLRGSQPARVITWVLSGVLMCCTVFVPQTATGLVTSFASAFADVEGSGFGLPTQRELDARLVDVVPGWFGSIGVLVTLSGMLALIAVVILLALPPSNRFFRKPVAGGWSPYQQPGYPGGYPQPMYGQPYPGGFGQPGQSPFGQPPSGHPGQPQGGQPPSGQPGQPQFGQSPFEQPGYPGQPPFGQPPSGQLGQPPFAQPGQPPLGQPPFGQPPSGQPGQPPFGQPPSGQPGQPPFGQPPFAPPGQPQGGQPSFGQPGQPAPGLPPYPGQAGGPGAFPAPAVPPGESGFPGNPWQPPASAPPASAPPVSGPLSGPPSYGAPPFSGPPSYGPPPFSGPPSSYGPPSYEPPAFQPPVSEPSTGFGPPSDPWQSPPPPPDLSFDRPSGGEQPLPSSDSGEQDERPPSAPQSAPPSDEQRPPRDSA
ncbi:hypothetical protein [Actinoplanes regularis]|uniref:hypothetical protein n=1 Tax=Actinoplanes regularis TaxID=52697 RepID=UPI00249FBCC0|nr:hypothetical protein [Actinoplanes regularis]GLW34029.1 hypothetical protein Areg01_69670 [Actinoplanes regularis]